MWRKTSSQSRSAKHSHIPHHVKNMVHARRIRSHRYMRVESNRKWGSLICWQRIILFMAFPESYTTRATHGDIDIRIWLFSFIYLVYSILIYGIYVWPKWIALNHTNERSWRIAHKTRVYIRMFVCVCVQRCVCGALLECFLRGVYLAVHFRYVRLDVRGLTEPASIAVAHHRNEIVPHLVKSIYYIYVCTF